MDLIPFAIFFLVALLGLAAQQWGVDSRDLNLDTRYPAATTSLD